MSKLHIIVAVHGIYTGSENWSDPFRRYVSDHAEHSKNIRVEEYDFGQIYAVQMYAAGIFSPLGWNMQNKFAKWFNEIQRNFYNKDCEFSFVAHSFGTWLTHGMLWRNKSIKPKNLVLLGSVLSEHFHNTKIPKMFARKQLVKNSVFWSPNDTIIEKTLVRVPPFGRLGSRGFVDGISSENVPHIKCSEAHSGYWSKKKREHYFEEIIKECVN